MNRKQKRTKTLARILAIIVALAMILMSGYYLLLAFSSGGTAFYVYAGEESPETIERNLKKLDLLREVVQYIDENYADDVNVEDLADAAYNGVFEALDPWSVYYKTQEEKDAFLQQVSGAYAGVGVTLSLDSEGRCVIRQVNLLGPAFEAGVTKGAVLLSVDGKPVEGLSLDQIAALLRGDAGTEAVLDIDADGERKTVTVTRQELLAQTVDFQMLEGNIGYISIS